MALTRKEATAVACALLALVKHTKARWQHPCDGFCDECPAGRDPGWHYQNSGREFRWIHSAILEKMKRQNLKPNVGANADVKKRLGRK